MLCVVWEYQLSEKNIFGLFMDALLENGWADPEEADKNSDSECSIVDEETEAVLYSLVHHKPASDGEEESSNVNKNLDGNQSSPFSVSSRSKASRWDRVKGITDSQNSGRNVVSSSSDFPSRMNSDSRGISVPDYINIQLSGPSFQLWRGDGKSNSNNNQAPRVNASPRSNPASSSQSRPNLRAVLEALASPVLEKESKKQKKKKKKKKRQRTEAENVSVIGGDPKVSSAVQNPDINSSLRSEQESNNAESVSNKVVEVSISKYDLNLSKSPRAGADSREILNQSGESDVIELFADSDFDTDSVDSIVVVEAPPKSPPPLIVLEDSSDETEEKRAPATAPPPSAAEPAPPVVQCLPAGQQVTLNTSSILESSVIVISDNDVNTKKRKKQSKVRKKKRRTKSPCAAIDRGDLPSSYPTVSDCNSWTPDMAHFYNQQWGSRDLDTIHKKMPGHPHHWKILDADRRGPLRMAGPHCKLRCRNCNQLGHLINRCPDPVKPPMCYMCGEMGHHEPRCPRKICLKCGRPSHLFTTGCAMCSAPGSEPWICSTCGKVGHYVYQCPTAWRGFHLVTSQNNISNYTNAPFYKSSEKLFCCVCTRRGHTAQQCPSYLHGNTAPMPSSPYLKPTVNGNHNYYNSNNGNGGRSYLDANHANGNFVQLSAVIRRQDRKRKRIQKFREMKGNRNVKGKKASRYTESYRNYSKIS